jgi:hypothetical protein
MENIWKGIIPAEKAILGQWKTDGQAITTILVDKNSRLYEINLYLPSLGAIVLR